MNSMVSLSAVSVMRSGVRILGPLSLEILAGEHHALLGPNGAGKSTLLSVIAGETHPTTGAVKVLGWQFGKDDIRKLRESVSAVNQRLIETLPMGSSVLDIVLTGKKNVLAPWWDQFETDDKQNALTALEAVGCKDLAKRAFGSCSQGEKQRILIARSLLIRHELFLFDEPCVGLDFPAREKLLLAVDHLAESNIMRASVYVAHYLEELPASLTHAMLLKDGLVVASGPLEEILTNANLSDLYEAPISVTQNSGRWQAFVKHRS
ncbi:MAG: ATP-binding cassette domain-containing protein [Firmicutes bacterium]|nr:ATP-binding cassette domain-containing protein [Bacillota bacterium]